MGVGVCVGVGVGVGVCGGVSVWKRVVVLYDWPGRLWLLRV